VWCGDEEEKRKKNYRMNSIEKHQYLNEMQ
jgi:hypothetical protein